MNIHIMMAGKHATAYPDFNSSADVFSEVNERALGQWVIDQCLQPLNPLLTYEHINQCRDDRVGKKTEYILTETQSAVFLLAFS